MNSQMIQCVSDTARWAAFVRAVESERPDGHFRDRYARRLAGKRGEALVQHMPKAKNAAWSIVVRTHLIDEMILRQVAAGVDTVINLAAGLDTRPLRLPLPATLRWIEIDLPQLIEEKDAALVGETPSCSLERLGLDLRDRAARREIFRRIGDGSRQTLVVSEGLLIYLPASEVASLAEDLVEPATFGSWVFDLASPLLLHQMQRLWGDAMTRGDAALQFAPPERTAFFLPQGWIPSEIQSVFEEGRRLRREMPRAWLLRLVLAVLPKNVRQEVRKSSLIVRLARRAEAA